MALIALALIIDWWVGDPDWLWRRVRHPVVWIGAFIGWFDRKCDAVRSKNAVKRRQILLIWCGFALVLTLLFIALAAFLLILAVYSMAPLLGLVVEVFIATILLAQKSLRDHVRRVATALCEDGLGEGRNAVAMIVGRDVSTLDESGVSKAAIESLAENYSDGVVAPAFWYAIGGLPWMIFYKAVNTADSMIGHRNESYEHFGKAAAKLDDLMNWIPARLSFVLILLATAIWKSLKRAGAVWSVTRRDASKHRSPNAGWPEAAFAASLDLQLGGQRNYGDDPVDGVVLNSEGLEEATVKDIDTALDLFRSVCLQLLVLVAVIWLAIP